MFPAEANESPDVLGPLAGVDETSGHEAALQLQQAILPTPLQRFSLGRYDLSVRYRPAESGNRVGGDWYDARLGPDGSAVVAIGDVAGHGLVAAAEMARIGNALRGLTVTGQPASTLLYWLNRLVCSDENLERVASAAVFVLDQDRPARAGPRPGIRRPCWYPAARRDCSPGRPASCLAPCRPQSTTWGRRNSRQGTSYSFTPTGSSSGGTGTSTKGS